MSTSVSDKMTRAVYLAALLAALVFSSEGYQVQTPEISLISPQGIRFAYPHLDDISLVAYHYSVNKPLNGVEAGDWNEDVNSNTGEYWIYGNTAVNVQIGDVVNYWVYVVDRGIGYQLLEQSWTPSATGQPIIVTSDPNQPGTNPANPGTGTTKASGGGGEPTAAPPQQTTKAPEPPATDPPVVTGNPGTGKTQPSGGGGGGNPIQWQCSSYPCDSSCDMSAAPCNGLIFQEEFDHFNLDIWEHEITAGGGGNWEFQYYTNNRTNSYVRDGALYLQPTLTTDNYGDDFLTSGTLNLWGASPANLCTGNAWWGCERAGTPSNILNPIQSARVRTVNSFSFKYGRLEVEAKLPTGDWLWPAIWLLPKHNGYGEWPASGEIDLVESRGNTNLKDSSGTSAGVDQMGSTMHWGPFWPYNGWPKTHATKNLENGETFGTGFHKYVLDWTPEYLKFYVDDELILTVDPAADDFSGFWDKGGFEQDAPGIDNPWAYTTNKLTPFDMEFYLILNVAVGGTNYFGDGLTNVPAKPWLNSSPTASKDFWDARDDWLPTWNGEDAAMQVNYIRVYAHPGSTTYHLRTGTD